jgi:anaerobic ribonucleoside-triphosphate reductase activating protein
MTSIRLADLRYPVATLGPGRRLGLWVQGCHLACPGCMSSHTWDPDAVDAQPVADVVDRCRDLADDALHGITISGGEPFEQADALGELIPALRELFADHDPDVLVYSGFDIEVLRHRHSSVLDLIDVVITGRYLAQQPTTAPWRGSANQQLIVLNDRFHPRYNRTTTERAGLQVTVDDDRFTLTGVPRPGELEQLRSALEAEGIHLRDVTWHS